MKNGFVSDMFSKKMLYKKKGEKEEQLTGRDRSSAAFPSAGDLLPAQ